MIIKLSNHWAFNQSIESVQSTIMSMLNTATSASTLQLWACWLSHNISSVYLLKHISYSAASACFLMLSFLDSIFFDSNFHVHFSLFFYLTDLILMFKFLIKFIITNSCSALCHALLEKSSVYALFSSYFVFLFEISVKSSVMSCYLISCSIFEKDLCLHFQISEVQISLAFVYNMWK